MDFAHKLPGDPFRSLIWKMGLTYGYLPGISIYQKLLHPIPTKFGQFLLFCVFAHACENCKVGLLEDDCINSRPFRENGTIGKIIIDMEGSLIFQERHFLSQFPNQPPPPSIVCSVEPRPVVYRKCSCQKMQYLIPTPSIYLSSYKAFHIFVLWDFYCSQEKLNTELRLCVIQI